MSDLPDREWAQRNAGALVGLNEYMGISTILLAYADGDLKSRDEMDEEAMWDAYKDGADIPEALDAAWGVTDG